MGILRLTGGHARGRPLSPAVPPGVRPTTARVREALFSMVGQHLAGVRWLDAFAGAGVVGLEAWSRGAQVVAVERDPRVAANLARRGRALGAQWQVYTRDVMRFAPQLDPFQVVFVDPPYDKPIEPVLTALAPCTTDWLVAEVRANQNPPKQVGACQLVRERCYGQSALWLYRVIMGERANQGEIA